MDLVRRINRGNGERGWRVLVPVFYWWRRGYRIEFDAFATGIWWFTLGFDFFALGATKRVRGVGFKVTWGWITNAEPEGGF